MSWLDRVKEAAYTSPSGVRQTFLYENVRNEIDKKTSAFDFPDADGTFVQDLGRSGRRYPLRVFFTGSDYDLDADQFDALLLEPGVGRLEHPLYGTVDVVPFGTISRRDDLKTGANQSITEVTFWETIGLIYPTSQADPAAEVQASLETFRTKAAETFEANTDLQDAIGQASLESTYLGLLSTAKGALTTIADTLDSVDSIFNAVFDSVNQGIDVLIKTPLTLALQTAIMVQAPSRATALIEDRLSAYSDLLTSITTGEGARVSPDSNSKGSNTFHTGDLFAGLYVSGSVSSAVNNRFKTRGGALAAAEVLLEQLDTLTEWRDAGFTALSQIDTGESYQQLQDAVARAAGFLVDISFTLKQERGLVVDRDRTVIDLVAELYGSVDDQLDFFINSNALSGSEILEIPRGREIVYYI